MAQSHAHVPIRTRPRSGHRRADILDIPEPVVGGVLTRVVLTILGSAGMVLGGFLAWFDGVAGTQLAMSSLFRPPTAATGFVSSAGSVAIALGLLTWVGLMRGFEWVTRLGGALAVLVFGLFSISAFRSGETAFLQHIDVGAWLVLLGGIAAIAGGLFPSRRADDTR